MVDIISEDMKQEQQQLEMLLEMLKERGFCGQDITVCYEPVTGAHVGPGAVALFFEGTHK